MRNTFNGNHLTSRLVLVVLLLAATASAQVRINSDSQLAGAGVGQVYNATIVAAGGTAPYTFQVTTGSLPGGLTLQTNGQIIGTPNAAGTASFTVTATDATSASAPKQFSLPVAATPLTLQVTGNSTSVGLGRYVELGFAGQGGVGPYRYRWVSGSTLPPGVVFDKETTVNGSFPQGFTRIRGNPRVAGTFPGVMEVIDAQARVAQANFTFTVTSDPLVLPGATLPDGRRHIPYSFQLPAATGGFGPIRYEQTGGTLPDGLTVSSDGRVEGRATSGVGPFNFSVSAIDANGVSVVQAYTMTMVNPPSTVIATPSVLPTGAAGVSYLTVIRKDSNTEFSTGLYSITGGSLPFGFSIGSDSGEISGTTLVAGVYNFQVTNDAGGDLLQKDFTLTISPTYFQWVSYPIKFLQAGQFTELIDATVETNGGTVVGPVRHTSGSWGPAFSSTPFNCCVVGTPPASTVYGFVASVTAEDGQVASSGFTVEISAVQPLVALNPASPPQGLLGQRYRFHESGCNPTCTNKGGGHPYRWSLSAGTLPTGLTLAPDGEISGIPTQSGAFFITLQLTDAYGSSVSQGYDLVIGDTSGSLTMTTTSPLPQGSINTPYSTDILTTGGTAPVAFSVTGGTTPPGVTLASNGTLSGTPTVGGNYNFTVSAFDSSPASSGGPLGVSRAFSLFIFSPTPPPTLSQISPNTIVEGSAGFTLTATGTDFSSPTILWNGSPLVTSPGSLPTEITAAVPAGLIAAAGIAQVSVRNGDMQVSAQRPFTITPRPPLLSSINPTQVNAGGPAFLLTATGQFFTATSPGPVILFGGVPLTTQSFSSTQVQAMVPEGLIESAEVVSVRVRNQDLQESNSQLFAVGNPPVLSTITPTLVATGSGAFTITATGTNFTGTSPGATVIFNGTPLTTSSFSATQVQATVPANLVTSPGQFEVWVRNQDLQESNVQLLRVATPPVLTSINPTEVEAGGPTFLLTATGTNFISGESSAVLLFNGAPIAVDSSTGTQSQVTIPASLITSPGVATIRMRNIYGQESNAVSLTIGSPPVLQTINPTLVAAGSGAFTLTATGTNFTATSPGAVVLLNGSPLTTVSFSATQVQATVPGNLITSPGVAAIRVRNQNQQVSNTADLVIATPPVLTSLAPQSAIAGSPALTLTLNGANFDEGLQVLWNGTPVPSVTNQGDVSTATIAANLLATPGTATVQVRNFNGLTSQTLVFTIQPQVSTITRLLPETISSGSTATTITIEGTNFRNDSVALFDGLALTTFADSATSIRALIDADRLSRPGAFPITVRSPQGALSNAVNLTVTGPGPQITALDPPNRPVGSPSFVLAVDGAGFEVLSVIRFNGVALSTDFFSTTRLRATVPANLLQVVGTVPVLVENPNGLRSAERQFAIRLPAPVIRSLVPSSVPAGSGPTQIIVEGTDFQAGAIVVVQGTDLVTTGPGNRLTATVPANLLAVAATLPVTVRNPDGQSAVAVNLTVTGTAPGPQITSLAPSGVQFGGSAFVLTVNGANFQSGATVLWGSGSLPTTFGSASQLTAQVTADRVAAPGSVAVTVRNPDGRTSSAVAFVISNLATPVLSSLNPTSATAGGAAFVLTLNGSGFQPGASVRWQGQDLPTTFASAAQVTATVAAQRIASAGQIEVTLRNPDGQVSNPLPFVIQAATPPVITSVTPNETVTGLASLLLDVRGQQFQAGALLLWNGEPLASTTVVSPTQLQAVVDQQRLQVPGSATLQVRNPNGQVSNSVPFVLRFVLPRILSMAPLAALAGATEVTLNLTVENVRNGSVVTWNGSPLPTVLTGPNQMTAQVLPASLLAQPGSASVAVRNPDGLASNSITFVILAPRPVISRIAPDRVIASQPDVRLQVFGSGFRPGVQVSLGGVPVTTSFLNSGELLIFVSPDRIAVPGPVSVQAVNADGQSSDAVQLTVLPSLTPELTGLTPGFVAVGSGNTLVAVAGRNFVPGARVLVEGAIAETRYVSETQLEMQVPQAQLGFVRALQLVVRNPDGKTSTPRSLTVGEPLRITAIELPAGVAGLAYRYVFRATGGVPDFRWTTDSALPAGLTLSPEGVLSGTPTGPPGTTALLVRVTDTAGNTAQAQAPLVIESADLEILSVSPLPPATAGAAYSFQFQARATAGLPLVWSVVEGTLPAGLELNAATGRVEGIAAEPPEPASTEASRAASVPVVFAFGVEVSALGRNPARRTFELTVLPATGEFRITTPAPLSPGAVRRPYAISFATAGGTLPVSFTLSGRLPAGVSLGADGRLTGVPEEAGAFPLTVQARDGAQRLATRTYEWQVRATAEGPEILSGPLLPITGGPAAMDVLIEARGGRRPFTWSIIAGSLPPGIRFDPVSARLTGTPLQTGIFRFTLRVVDADGRQDLRVIELPVTATGEPLQLVTQTLPGIGLGTAYNAALEARGGMPPYRFAVAEGSLPAGLSLVGAQIQGVPLVPGTSTFRLRVTDEIGFVLLREFTITTTLGVVPALSITGLPDRIEPGSQPRVGVQLAAPYGLDLLGNLGLTFVSDPPVAGIDPALQFSSGGRTVTFRIPAGQTEAVFPQATLALQTGTVAGVLTAAINGLQAGGTAAATANRPDRTVQITHLPPVVREALFEATPTGFTLTVTGFSTTREVQEAVVTLTPAPGQQLQSTTLVVPLATVFRQWYDSTASLPFGTQFRLALPFNATAGAVQSATIRLRNSIGESR